MEKLEKDAVSQIKQSLQVAFEKNKSELMLASNKYLENMTSRSAMSTNTLIQSKHHVLDAPRYELKRHFEIYLVKMETMKLFLLLRFLWYKKIYEKT